MSLGQDGPPTRTRMPEGHGGGTGGRRQAQPRRAMVTVVGIVVLLIAAIAFANRGDGSGSSHSGGSAAGGSGGGKNPASSAPTAPTGEHPVTGKTAGIPAGFAHTEQGAQSAAANYAVALGGDEMFHTDTRHQIIDRLYTADAAAKVKGPQDRAYSPAFLAKLGLDANGDAPKGMTFVSRTVPVGTKTESYGGATATVSVWYTGLIGMAGTGSTDPVRTDWKTWTFTMSWTANDWKISAVSQKSGPAPVPGDIPASGAQDITNAVQQFGAFTYAR
ncbi:MAG: hypothetical protein FWE15_30425 [Actinomycetia bacterium]|nr:hypothetical protein [Actinomycetes bacterium]